MTNGKRKRHFVLCRRKFVFLGRQTINGNRHWLFQPTSPFTLMRSRFVALLLWLFLPSSVNQSEEHILLLLALRKWVPPPPQKIYFSCTLFPLLYCFWIYLLTFFHYFSSFVFFLSAFPNRGGGGTPLSKQSLL
jgi:hypothetical protein